MSQTPAEPEPTTDATDPVTAGTASSTPAGDAPDAPDATGPALVETTEPGEVLVRRAPRYGRFITIGGAVGVVVALILTFAFPANEKYDLGQVFGFLLLAGVAVGVALGALVAIILDRTSAKRARELAAVHETGRRAA